MIRSNGAADKALESQNSLRITKDKQNAFFSMNITSGEKADP